MRMWEGGSESDGNTGSGTAAVLLYLTKDRRTHSNKRTDRHYHRDERTHLETENFGYSGETHT